ncbi:MAG TPA: hypothetical protein VFS20_20410 [Longimicrobium sp.]|nr:hypothetical protein [Longimicrobium sp.]
MNKIITAAVLLAASASTAGAQGSRVRPTPAAGELIRVTPDSGGAFTGRLAALGGDTLVLDPSDRGSAVMAVASRERVEVHRSHRELWSGLGALAGIATGFVASQLQSGGPDAGRKKTTIAVVGGAAGGMLGGFFGFVVAPHQWQRLRSTARRGPAPVVAASATLPPPPPADIAPAATIEQAPQSTASEPAQPTPTPADPTQPPAPSAPPATVVAPLVSSAPQPSVPPPAPPTVPTP